MRARTRLVCPGHAWRARSTRRACIANSAYTVVDTAGVLMKRRGARWAWHSRFVSGTVETVPTGHTRVVVEAAVPDVTDALCDVGRARTGAGMRRAGRHDLLPANCVLFALHTLFFRRGGQPNREQETSNETEPPNCHRDNRSSHWPRMLVRINTTVRWWVPKWILSIDGGSSKPSIGRVAQNNI